MLANMKSLKPVDPLDVLRERLANASALVSSTLESLTKPNSGGVARAYSMPSDEELEAMAKKVGAEWRPGYASRVIPYRMSDERVDSYGDIVRSVWDFSIFESNPVAPFAHNWWSAPVGKWIDWRVMEGTTKGYKGPALFGLLLFPEAAVSEQSDSMFRLVRSGLVVGNSVGFRPKKVLRVEDPDERATLGLGQWGVVFEESLLLECSPCPIPANPGALADLAKAKSAGDVRAQEVAMLREVSRAWHHARGDEQGFEKTDDRLLMVARSLFPRSRFEPRKGIDDPFGPGSDARRVVPVTGTARADDAEDDPIARIEAKVDALALTVEQSVLGLTAMLEDVQAKLEELGAKSVDDSQDDDEDDAADGTKGAKPAAADVKNKVAALLKAVETFKRSTQT